MDPRDPGVAARKPRQRLLHAIQELLAQQRLKSSQNLVVYDVKLARKLVAAADKLARPPSPARVD